MSRKTYGLTLRGLACALLAWQVWLVWHLSTYDVSTVVWACDQEGCGSDQFASLAPELGIASAALLGFAAARFLHRATVGAVISLSAIGAAAGWYDAVSDGRVGYGTVTDFMLVVPAGRHTVSGWLTFLWAVAAAGGLVAVWGGAVSLRRTAALRRLRADFATAEARLQGWRPVRGRRGEVTVVFHDAQGARHSVSVVVDRAALDRPVLAVYDRTRPADPRRTRVAVPRRRRLRSS
ncbi:hypothetical protein [Streptomyces flavofungini]|uniref:Uncharacterized protein n=1 Tax=Streptomyces flavofungini TaxID=68200 RepID=A0ABS0XFG9_9ACTN|nr:hypothetical protein [Streptomyces flavofungini]MBJ3811940.1 hypothetical protein [Streptomyces flavofungini]GHC52304.1 hypothetical protein GCM10010349_17860 [Streptomyces flavofungini]